VKTRNIGVLLAGVSTLAGQPTKDIQSIFPVEKRNLGVKGSNPYFPLTPGYQLSYRDGKNTETLTVLNETKVIDGVETRVVEDRVLRGRRRSYVQERQGPERRSPDRGSIRNRRPA
jgi:hypothetical protein